jgi:hypothetical protein
LTIICATFVSPQGKAREHDGKRVHMLETWTG